MGANTDKVKGRTKQAVGAVTGDEELKREGQVDEDAGAVKKKVGEVVDTARDAVKTATDHEHDE